MSCKCTCVNEFNAYVLYTCLIFTYDTSEPSWAFYLFKESDLSDFEQDCADDEVCFYTSYVSSEFRFCNTHTS